MTWRLFRVALGLVLVAGLVWAALWYHSRSPQPALVATDDPRLLYPTPYLNVHPSVKYVGNDRCAECHLGHVKTYARHSMGRSAAFTAERAASQRYDAASNNPFTSGGFAYSVERRGDRIMHRESQRDARGQVLTSQEEEVAFAIGSGGRGFSYAINHEGYLFQSSISWFSQKERWDLSPGYQNRDSHFGRPLVPACLFCHCDRLEPVEHTVNRYRLPLPPHLALSCERCHGPGEVHVREQRANRNTSFTIVNPRDLEPRLREAVCQQCHLQARIRVLARNRQPFDYRPGLPLELFWDAFELGDAPEDDLKAVGHVEQMYASRCFRASGTPAARVREKLGCISCHNPHELPSAEKKEAYYRERCLNCHQEAGCSLPVALRRERNQDDSCVACHLPRVESADVVHTAVTDHRIRRHGQAASARAAPQGDEQPPKATLLVSFFRGLPGLTEEEALRNQGLALASAARSMPEMPLRRRFIMESVPLLSAAVESYREDVPAWEALGFALEKSGDPRSALTVYETALDLAPESEMALVGAAANAAALGDSPLALDYWQRTVRVDPWRAAYHFHAARLLGGSGQWPQARDAARSALRLEPANLEFRLVSILTHLRAGEKERALAEGEVLPRLPPERRQFARRWLEQQRLLSAEEKALLSRGLNEP